jgi:divalent metal cation (Fe/Co/Zn/Cd) transporter
MRVLWISLGVLGVTVLVQVAVTVVSGSVAPLGDALPNTADALTAVPLGVAVILGRRPGLLNGHAAERVIGCRHGQG